MKIGILKAGSSPRRLADRHPDYDQMFVHLLDGHGFDFQSYDVQAGVFPDDVAAADGWLITGSACGAYEDHAWISPLEDFIRAAQTASVRMIGICFGHQIMAQALGGHVEKFAGGRSMGAVTYKVVDPNQAVETGETLTLLAFHQDQVMDVPPGAQVTLTSDFCPVAGLAYGDHAGTAWGMSLQPHPEFDVAYVTDLIEAYEASLPADRVAEARASMSAVLSNVEAGKRMAAFLADRKQVTTIYTHKM